MTNIIGNHIDLGKFNFLQQMDILLKIEEAVAGKEDGISLCLKNAVKNKPASLIIKETKEMIEDNETTMRNILGVNLCEKIKTFK